MKAFERVLCIYCLCKSIHFRFVPSFTGADRVSHPGCPNRRVVHEGFSALGGLLETGLRGMRRGAALPAAQAATMGTSLFWKVVTKDTNLSDWGDSRTAYIMHSVCLRSPALPLCLRWWAPAFHSLWCSLVFLSAEEKRLDMLCLCNPLHIYMYRTGFLKNDQPYVSMASPRT